MTLAAAEVEIQRPCPVDLPEDFRGGARNRHCAHCDKTVHLLSSLTEPQARAFLADNEGKDICVTYLVDHTGQIQFRPEPTVVPIAALRRPRLAAAAAVGLGLALAACTPHDNPRIETHTDAVQVEISRPVVPTEPCPPPEPTMVAGGIGVEPMDFEPPPVEPPPVVEPVKVKKPVEPERRMLAGGIRPMREPPPPPVRTVRGGRG